MKRDLILTIFGAFSALCLPAHSNAAILTASQATYVRSNANGDNNFGSSNSLEVAHRGSANRKTYIEFNLEDQIGTGEWFSEANFSLTTSGTPLIGTATGNVTFTIYGLTNGVNWLQNTLTWNNSGVVGNDGTPTGTNPNMTTVLGTITINTDTVSANQTLSFTSVALTNYLNWAAGNLGDFYNTGILSDLTPTLIVTAQGATLNSAGVAFWSDSATTLDYRPSLTFTVVPEPGTASLLFLICLAGITCITFSRRAGNFSKPA